MMNIFGIFPKNKIIEDDNSSESEESEEFDLDTYIFGEPIYSTKVFDGIHYEKYITKISKIKNVVNKWEFNRKVSQEHVDNIKKSVLSQKFPYFMGSIKIVKIDDDDYRLIDGQHRVESIWQLRESDFDFDMDVEVDLYHLLNAEDNLLVKELFKCANNNKNVEDKDVPSTKIIKVIDALVKKWPNNIKTKENAGAYKPNVTSRELYLKLKPIINMSNLDSESIIKKIYVLNDRIGDTKLRQLFGRDKVAERKLKIHEKAEKHKFYLNMDCIMNIDWWVNQV